LVNIFKYRTWACRVAFVNGDNQKKSAHNLKRALGFFSSTYVPGFEGLLIFIGKKKIMAEMSFNNLLIKKKPGQNQNDNCTHHPKGAFFQKVRFIFQLSQSPKRNIRKIYPELEILKSRPSHFLKKSHLYNRFK
jgi:hypothetical protein